MNSTSIDILNPVISVPNIKGETVDVKELTWKEYLRAMKELASSMLRFLEAGKTELTLAVVLDPKKIIEAIGEQEAMVEWILAASTNRKVEWIRTLSGREILALLEAVVQLNLSDEVVSSGKALAGRMRVIFGSTKSLPGQPITSSAPATHFKT